MNTWQSKSAKTRGLTTVVVLRTHSVYQAGATHTLKWLLGRHISQNHPITMRIAHARILLLEFNAENCLPFLLVFLPLVLFGFLSLCPTHRQSWWGLWMLRRLLACRAALPTRWQWMSRAKYLPGGPAVRASWGWAWQSRSSECLGTVGLTGWVYQGIMASVGHVTNFLQSNTTVGIMQWQKERQLSSALLKFKCHPCYPSFQCLWVCCMTMSLVGNISSQLVFLLALKHGRGSILCLVFSK